MMSKLAMFGRPYVTFDATNKEHRKWFKEHQDNSTWSKCPVRFIIDEEYGDLITMIKSHLINFYIEQEFGKVSRRKKVAAG